MTARRLAVLGGGLLLLTAATPPRVELSRTVCTPRGACVTLADKERDGGLLRLEEKLPRKVAPGTAFGFWLTWPQDSEDRQRELGSRSEELHQVTLTPAGRFELFSPAALRVRRAPSESAGVLVHVSFDPREKAPLVAALPEVVAAAQARELLTPEQQQALASRQKALEERLPALVRAMDAFRERPADMKAREAFLSTLLSFPGEELNPTSPSVAPERFLSAAQRTALRKAGYEVLGRQGLEYPATPGVVYRLMIQASSVEQLVREWNAGLRGSAANIEDVPRPALEFERAHRYDDVSFTLEVRGDSGRTRMDQVLERLLQVPGVRRAPGPPLPSPR
ncbi:hypothetical protein [Hyalangium rubrum]|uniref:Uncharacterized protein n=1 Tax=Hyalangium rubrum TaxID=3103134 RepID=A0ABU5H317_9BACT|nr:hypothetical protein [Hyalangium sp. s54d21]MDY7227188.1 hypothetical protein [Hyalangium sp. s54d21]